MQVSKKAIARSGRSVLAASDQLDDGSPITLRVELDSECGGALFDFTGTSPQVSSNVLMRYCFFVYVLLQLLTKAMRYQMFKQHFSTGNWKLECSPSDIAICYNLLFALYGRI